jgi:hypothetical protein
MPCPYCAYVHPPSSLGPCLNRGCGRMDCVHNPDPPHTIQNSQPTCPGYQAVEGEGYEGGGGQFGGGGASGGW